MVVVLPLMPISRGSRDDCHAMRRLALSTPVLGESCFRPKRPKCHHKTHVRRPPPGVIQNGEGIFQCGLCAGVVGLELIGDIAVNKDIPGTRTCETVDGNTAVRTPKIDDEGRLASAQFVKIIGVYRQCLGNPLFVSQEDLFVGVIIFHSRGTVSDRLPSMLALA